MNKIGIISLGCDKNRVDTENMLAFLQKDGYTFTGDPADADIIIINTCAFIESAKIESIETILEMAEYKVSGKCKCLIVSGCLTQRYMDELKDDLSEVDIFLGTAGYKDLHEILANFNGERVAHINDKNKREEFSGERVLTTPYHYAYVKIAEGCNNHCTYCAIPSIRGKYTSRKIEDIVSEVSGLIKSYGVKELNIVAQDITRYGEDIYGEIKLIELLEELSKLDVKWIRLLYCYPEQVTDKLLEYIGANPKIVKYIDIPMQHASSVVLKRMNRRINNEQLVSLISKIRNIVPEMAIRTTFIVGFPGETDEDFNVLKGFIENSRFDKCGFFAYSREEGTPAYNLDGQIDEQVKEDRVAQLYAIQEKIMAEKCELMIGKSVEVMYEDVDYDRQCFIGRTKTDAPEIDGVVYFTAINPLDIGEIYTVKIVDTDGVDLIGEIS